MTKEEQFLRETKAVAEEKGMLLRSIEFEGYEHIDGGRRIVAVSEFRYGARESFYCSFRVPGRLIGDSEAAEAVGTHIALTLDRLEEKHLDAKVRNDEIPSELAS